MKKSRWRVCVSNAVKPVVEGQKRVFFTRVARAMGGFAVEQGNENRGVPECPQRPVSQYPTPSRANSTGPDPIGFPVAPQWLPSSSPLIPTNPTAKTLGRLYRAGLASFLHRRPRLLCPHRRVPQPLPDSRHRCHQCQLSALSRP